MVNLSGESIQREPFGLRVCIFPATVWKREQGPREPARALKSDQAEIVLFSAVLTPVARDVGRGIAPAKCQSMNESGDLSGTPVSTRARRSPIAAADSKRRLRLWMVDDHVSLREGFAQLLNAEPGLRVVRQFDSVQPMLAALAEERPPDIILLDLNIGKENGL